MKLVVSLIALLACGTAIHASTAYGTLNNFDVVNDTGQPAYGFEIELEDVRSTDITYTYDYNHYGTPRIREDSTVPAHPRVFIRYESSKNALGQFTAFTAVPTRVLAPTDGHQCTNPAVNEGCEHFGVGFYGVPAAVRYFWLVDDGAGNLVRGPAVNVSTPTWIYSPPVGVQPAQVQAVIAAPEPPEVIVKEFGEAVWVKSIVTTTHNAEPVELRDLVSDDPDDDTDSNWTNGEPDEVEVEWSILQQEFSQPEAGNGELFGGIDEIGGDEVVTRRYEFFKYAGPYDEETNEALCDSYPDPMPTEECDVELLGDYIGAQMAGFNVEAPLGMIDNLQDGQDGEPYPSRTVVVGGNSPYITSVIGGVLPSGIAVDEATGVLSGTPEQSGTFTFTLNALDADSVTVTKEYQLIIVPAPVVVVPGDLDGDADIDVNDLNLMRALFGRAASGADDPADVNRDGTINVLDFRKAVTLCTRLRCAI